MAKEGRSQLEKTAAPGLAPPRSLQEAARQLQEWADSSSLSEESPDLAGRLQALGLGPAHRFRRPNSSRPGKP
ncbi:hypothetical protein ACIBL8_37240 [Streptomyces sp. NPDC050523]|uniref:hypothetical protein n=1 Tax=Streptomyces sp. NPDC050523 TaxID=3365622 RepID=UPI0037A96334